MAETDLDVRQDLFEQEFEEHARVWRIETVFSSTIQDISSHPSYQKIIKMGPGVLPLIFRELELEEDFWFWALREITEEDPVPDKHRGNVPKMAKYWLKWAKRKKIQW